jgi:uncharacterized membrane protein YuzA (DUF378 family)
MSWTLAWSLLCLCKADAERTRKERIPMASTDSHAKGSSALLKVATLLASIGALNWGLIGLFNWNLVDAIFGGGAQEMTSVPSRVVYAIVGLAGLIALFSIPRLTAPEHHPAPTVPYRS